MGIAHNEFHFLITAYNMGILPQGVKILEIGEARSFVRLIEVVENRQLSISGEVRERLFADAIAYNQSITEDRRRNELVGFFVAKQIYKILFSYEKIVSIDYSGSDQAIKVDLNQETSLGETFDVCINCGTTEHIFNQAQAFKAIHDHVRPGGLMIHWLPTHGFNHINHGMYLIQPGLFYDLAHANGYEIKLAAVANLEKVMIIDSPWLRGSFVKENLGDQDTYTMAILQKKTDEPFRYPQQYESRTSKDVLAASWELLQDVVR